MKKQKSLIQRLQSRIALRRPGINEVNRRITLLVSLKKSDGLHNIHQMELTKLRKCSRDMGHVQKLDKELYQALLEHRREAIGRHFRSAYAPAPRVRLIPDFDKFWLRVQQQMGVVQ